MPKSVVRSVLDDRALSSGWGECVVEHAPAIGVPGATACCGSWAPLDRQLTPHVTEAVDDRRHELGAATADQAPQCDRGGRACARRRDRAGGVGLRRPGGRSRTGRWSGIPTPRTPWVGATRWAGGEAGELARCARASHRERGRAPALRQARSGPSTRVRACGSLGAALRRRRAGRDVAAREQARSDAQLWDARGESQSASLSGTLRSPRSGLEDVPESSATLGVVSGTVTRVRPTVREDLLWLNHAGKRPTSERRNSCRTNRPWAKFPTSW